MSAERRPAGAPSETVTSESILAESPCDHSVCWACQHAAELAGFERGQHHPNRVAAEAIAQELLQERANEMLGLARREATKVGPAWAAMIEDAAAAPWEARG